MGSDAEVIVVGAGPAGCAVALHLAARGHEVLVVDRAEFPRDKPCGEGLMPHGREALARLGLDAPGQDFVGIAYHLGGHRAVGRFPGDLRGRGVRRRDLDAALVLALGQAPRVEVRTGVAVRGLAGRPGAMEVHTDRGPLRARAVVGADGLSSKVRRLAGLEGPTGGSPRYGARLHLEVRPELVPDVVEVHVADAGELYLTPVGPGTINVAALLGKGATRGLRGDLEGGLRRLIAAFPEVADRFGGAPACSAPLAWGPLRRAPTDVVADGVLLVGDAAGFVDAITGEGMSLGLLSAELGAEVLSAGLRRGRLDARSLGAYRERRRRANRDLSLLTETVLWGIRHRRLASRVVRNLGRDPALFSRLLSVNVGRASLVSVGWRDGWRLLAP